MIALLCAGGYIVYTEFFTKKEESKINENKNESINDTKTNEELSLSQLENFSMIYNFVDRSIVNNSMMAHMPLNNQPDYFYKQDKLYVSEMRSDVLFSMVTSYLQLGKGDVNKLWIDNNTIKNIFIRLFNNYAKYNPGNYKFSVWNYQYSKEEDLYRAEFMSIGNVVVTQRVNKLIKVIKTKDTIEVYDLIAYIAPDGKGSLNICAEGCGDCKAEQFKRCTALKKTDINEQGRFTGNLEDYKDNLDQYKYIFKLNTDGNYYFYGVERVLNK